MATKSLRAVTEIPHATIKTQCTQNKLNFFFLKVVSFIDRQRVLQSGRENSQRLLTSPGRKSDGGKGVIQKEHNCFHSHLFISCALTFREGDHWKILGGKAMSYLRPSSIFCTNFPTSDGSFPSVHSSFPFSQLNVIQQNYLYVFNSYLLFHGWDSSLVLSN